jgi:hypothetical protein
MACGPLAVSLHVSTDVPKLAHSIGELSNNGPIGRSSIYNAIAAGKLRARKIGRRTIILDDDWRAFLRGAPAIAPIKAPTPADKTASPVRRRRGTPRKVPADPSIEPVVTPTAGKPARRLDTSSNGGAES